MSAAICHHHLHYLATGLEYLHAEDSWITPPDVDPDCRLLRHVISCYELLSRELQTYGETSVSEALRRGIEHGESLLRERGFSL